MGWRYLFFSVASISLGIFIIRFFIVPFYESPKFLISKGNDRDAVEVVHKIAIFNKRPCDLTVESLYERCKEPAVTNEKGFSRRLVSEISRLKLLFGNWKLARITILVWITWMFNFWGSSIAVTYLPTILQRKNSVINVGLKQTYIDYLIIYSSGFVAVTLSVLMVRAPMVGRKWTLVIASAAMGISLFLFSIVNTEASYVGLNLLEYFCLSLFNAALYGWTPEAFPVAVRGTATGLATFFGSLCGICAPLVAAQLLSTTNEGNGVLYLAGSSVFVCTIAILSLPTKDMVAPR